jgi:hypothetical protein
MNRHEVRFCGFTLETTFYLPASLQPPQRASDLLMKPILGKTKKNKTI